MTAPRFDRRQVLTAGLGAAVALGAPAAESMRKHGPGIVRKAASTKAAGSDLGAVNHVVFLMHENRSFDHYFGKLGGVDGFNTSSPAFAQTWPGGTDPTLLPYHLDTTTGMAECTYDLDHTWGAEHSSWNGGAMDSFVSTHVVLEGQNHGPLTMGYYDTGDIPFYYALAKAFTVCDRYFCSVLGPTHPNRMLQMTGTLDPAGTHGGPILTTSGNNVLEFTCSWTTAPEVLEDHGVSWKVYNPSGGNYLPGSNLAMTVCKNVLMYFEQYQNKGSGKKLFKKAFSYSGTQVPKGTGLTAPGTDHFMLDVQHNRLPKVSWIMPPVGYDEHPPAPAALGQWYTAQVIKTLMSNPKVWAKTVLFIMYDENDGWFDHVAPPTAPLGTAGEYVTKSPLPSGATGVAGPVGLGVRVPMLVVSPFSRGGWVNHDVLDHTSQLKFIEQRWGVKFPNISAWRRSKVKDLTGTLPTLSSANTSKPVLPATSSSTTNPALASCSSSQLIELNFTNTPAYPVPSPQSQPTQDPGTLRATPS